MSGWKVRLAPTGVFHETHSDESAVLLAIYRKLNVFQNTVGFYKDDNSKGFEK